MLCAMTIWAIADLHLSTVQPKPMDIFGDHWHNHAERIATAWRAQVAPDDLVLLAGDISWALKLPAALPDLYWIAALPGTKVMIRGNHDYWYPRKPAPLRKHLPESIIALGGDAVATHGVVVCGTRGWLTPDFVGFDPATDERIYRRELGMLDTALAHAHRLAHNNQPIIALLHFPPFVNHHPTAFAQRLSAAGVAVCLYGHLHRREDWAAAVQGIADGVRYQLTACDYLNFAPTLVRGVQPE